MIVIGNGELIAEAAKYDKGLIVTSDPIKASNVRIVESTAFGITEVFPNVFKKVVILTTVVPVRSNGTPFLLSESFTEPINNFLRYATFVKNLHTQGNLDEYELVLGCLHQDDVTGKLISSIAYSAFCAIMGHAKPTSVRSFESIKSANNYAAQVKNLFKD